MRRGLILVVLALAALPTPALAQGQLRAGAAAVDASWHVGASAGQYASDPQIEGGFDPTTHSTIKAGSYGIQSRLTARALVVEGPDGKRVALVKNDLYIPQDLLWRRTALLLERGGSGIGRTNLTMAVTHDHSSPFYSSTSPGAWTFQDVFDVRFYDYYAKRMAAAVEKAAADLKPVRVGASVSTFDKTHRHSFGPAVADDGTPAGYPNSDADHDLTVVRFDDISDPSKPRPLANLVNYSLHPEMLNGNNLISADYVAPLERMVDRRTKALTIYTQNAVGTAEPERSSFHDYRERLEFTHREYAQSEYAARLMANAITDTARDIGRATPEQPDRFVPLGTGGRVQMEDRWFPGPLSHPYPGVTNCRTDTALAGNPQVEGLPSCEGVQSGLSALAGEAGFDEPPLPPLSAADPGIRTDDFQRLGIPVPENYSVPSYGALQEDVSVHLQAFRIGEILFTVCSCEQWADQARNIKSRTQVASSGDYVGYDWSKQCTQNADGTWTCPNPEKQCDRGVCPASEANAPLPPIPDERFRRMRAQVVNDAAGWNEPLYAPYAESEPVDTTQIKGNYTHGGLPAEQRYRLTVPIGMANDYNGYIATYREYQRGDHYRKALTAWGPHSSDYMASRLVALGGRLNGGPDLPAEVGQEKVAADLALNDQRAAALGSVGETAVAAYEAALPDDGGEARALDQPADVERFGAAFFTWVGGSNFSDDPVVTVERRVRGRWQAFADQSGELPVTLRFPQGEDVASYLTGGHEWRWTAHFEAFSAPFDTGRGRATPAGTYRFVARGVQRKSRALEPYTVASESFSVRPWSGVTVEDLRVGKRGRVSFRVGPRTPIEVPRVEAAKAPRGPTEVHAPEEGDEPPELGFVTARIGPIDYPDSYKSPARFVKDVRSVVRDPAAPNDPRRFEWYCFACSFRPWLDAGDAKTAWVSFETRSRRGPRAARVRRVRAVKRGDRWYARRTVCGRWTASVASGDVRDRFGNRNGAASGRVSGRTRPVGRCAGSGRQRGGRRRGPAFTG
jgi:hypothetical protein